MKRKGFLLILMLLLTLTCTALAEPLVRAGGSFGIAVDAQGGVWGWGDNANGQLGNGNNKRVYLPKAAAVGLDGTQIVDVQCGNVNTLFLMQDGTVYTCGYNNYGQQGLPEGGSHIFTPTQIPGLENIAQIACGFGQCLARTADGEVYAWGRNNCGQLGIGTTYNAKEPVLLELENIVDIQCGGKFSMAMDAEGNIWGWGDNESGQLLDTGKKKKVTAPLKLEVSGRFTQIACGGSTALGLDQAGKLWSWGKNDYGQMGTDEVGAYCATPTAVKLPEGLHIEQLHAYNSHSAVVTAEGEVYQWGRTYSGQLGNGKRPTKSLPVLACPEDQPVVEAATGSSCTYVLLADGSVRTSGYSAVGQTGAFPTKQGYIAHWVFTGLNLFTGEWAEPKNR